MMMTTIILGTLLFISTCTEARTVVTEDHHDHDSSHHNGTNHTTVKNTTSMGLLTKNLLFVGEGQEGTPKGVGPSGNSTSTNDNNRGEKQYYVPYPSAVNPYGPFAGAGAGPYSPYYNPYPDYYASAIALGAGVTGPGNKASSCAYAYPNRRYSCLGLGRRK